MSKQENKQFIISMVLIVLILSSALGFIYITDRDFKENIPQEIKKTNKISTLLKVSVHDSEGKLKSYMEKPDDLLTVQFIEFLAGILKGSPASGSHSITIKNDANADKTIKLVDDYGGFLTNAYSDCATGTSKKGGLVGIGTGSTAPARSNYALETKVEVYSDISTAPVWDSGAGTISLSGNVAITAGRTITEAILGVRWIDSAGSDQVFIFAHDTFAGQAVVNTDVVAVAYVITLTGAEFTDNFGKYLTTVLTTINDGGSKSASYTDTGNTARTIYTYRSGNYLDTFSHQTDLETDPLNRMQIGTNNGALARSSYHLGASTQAEFGFNTLTDSTGLTINGSITMISAVTVNEIAIYTIATNVPYRIMMFRLLTVGDAVAVTDVYLIKIRIDC